MAAIHTPKRAQAVPLTAPSRNTFKTTDAAWNTQQDTEMVFCQACLLASLDLVLDEHVSLSCRDSSRRELNWSYRHPRHPCSKGAFIWLVCLLHKHLHEPYSLMPRRQQA